MILSCPNYLHADVSDGEDLSRHQQEVTGGQLVTKSLVPGTVGEWLIPKICEKKRFFDCLYRLWL